MAQFGMVLNEAKDEATAARVAMHEARNSITQAKLKVLAGLLCEVKELNDVLADAEYVFTADGDDYTFNRLRELLDLMTTAIFARKQSLTD